MVSIVEEIKRQNNAIAPRFKRWIWVVVLVLFVVGLALVVSGSDMLLTPGVLLIFSSMVLSILGLFLFALHASDLRTKRIANTIEIGYRAVLEQYNREHDTDYRLQTHPTMEEDWVLLPSFAHRNVHYGITKGSTRFYHGQSFIQAAADQRKTYFLRGLYIIIDGPKGAFQYRSRTHLGGTLIEALKDLVGPDRFDVSQFPEHRAYQGGTLFHDESPLPAGLPDWISFVQDIPYVRSFRIGLHASRLHLALELDTERLPYIGRGTKEEWAMIEQTVTEHLQLLEQWTSIVTTKD